MPPTITFSNPGEIDPRLISSFGVNVKPETDSPIGFFGTGLKYALSILLRTGHKVTIHSGLETHEFGLEEQTIRGKSFTFITMSGQPLGFTTELGKNWELWMAYRELYCNALDEGGQTIAGPPPSPSVGHTHIIVSGDKILSTHNKSDTFILRSKPLFSTPKCDVHTKVGEGLFYRGIRASETSRPTLYTYNIREGVTLTEDRTISDMWLANRSIASAIVKSDDASFLRSILTVEEPTFEYHLDLNWSSLSYSEAFLDTVQELVRHDAMKINFSARAAYERLRDTRALPTPIDLDPFEQTMLAHAQAFCAQAGFDTGEYSIIAVDSLGPSILGLAADGKIYITRANFTAGTKQLACTLIEEFIHLRYGLHDLTRGLQEFLLQRLITSFERIRDEPL